MSSHLKPITVFVSYASVDRATCEEIVAALNPLEVRRLISIWYDRSLTPGDRYFEEIMKNLAAARLVLLLVSNGYIASHACGVEFKQALAQADDGKSKVLPIILEACDWKDKPYRSLQALPPAGKPLASAADRGAALTAVMQGVEAAIKGLSAPSLDRELEIFSDADLREMRDQIETSIATIKKAHSYQPQLPVNVLLELNQLQVRQAKFEKELAARLGRF